MRVTGCGCGCGCRSGCGFVSYLDRQDALAVLDVSAARIVVCLHVGFYGVENVMEGVISDFMEGALGEGLGVHDAEGRGGRRRRRCGETARRDAHTGGGGRQERGSWNGLVGRGRYLGLLVGRDSTCRIQFDCT